MCTSVISRSGILAPPPLPRTRHLRSVYFGQSGTTVRPLISRLDLSWGGEAKLAFEFKWLSKLFPLAFPPLANRTLPSLHTRMSEYYFPSWNDLIDRPRHQRHFLLAFTNHFSHHLSFPQRVKFRLRGITRGRRNGQGRRFGESVTRRGRTCPSTARRERELRDFVY